MQDAPDRYWPLFVRQSARDFRLNLVRTLAEARSAFGRLVPMNDSDHFFPLYLRVASGGV